MPTVLAFSKQIHCSTHIDAPEIHIFPPLSGFRRSVPPPPLVVHQANTAGILHQVFRLPACICAALRPLESFCWATHSCSRGKMAPLLQVHNVQSAETVTPAMHTSSRWPVPTIPGDSLTVSASCSRSVRASRTLSFATCNRKTNSHVLIVATIQLKQVRLHSRHVQPKHVNRHLNPSNIATESVRASRCWPLLRATEICKQTSQP